MTMSMTCHGLLAALPWPANSAGVRAEYICGSAVPGADPDLDDAQAAN